MKKIIALLLCVAALSACTSKNPTTVPTASPIITESPKPGTVKTMISASDIEEIPGDWTALGEVGVIIDGEYTDIVLATDAKRGRDGFMDWDDSQNWRLVAINDLKEYDLFDSYMSGVAYIEVAMEGDSPIISLITTGETGMSITEYTYTDGAFYSETIIEPSENGNKIYSSFPEYFE